ncbi:MAG: nucleoside triphosphate pyrophosphohydrolase [Candidatus Cloacimonadota bacterium]|nr:nucleoside triphosphate pyrophosphohydrolase [Candidatus Cloacimonadota bacterium]
MKNFDELIEIVKKLRNPKDGCPWDIKQTSKSLIPNFIEELYETVEAIENEDYSEIKEELGDLLLHIVFQALIGEEKNELNFNEILQNINNKLIRRHPHVFDNLNVANVQEVQKNWELIKQNEKKATRHSVIDGIPKSMPALIIAYRMQEKAASVGFDWPSSEPVLDKIREEIDELEVEIINKNKELMEEEMGDLLFSIVNLCRKHEIDSESALRIANKKFEQRFKQIEKYYKENNLDIKNSTLEQLDEIWENVKKTEK